ncbi:MAG: hypothetical protein O2913_11275 [Chloroflexi bacterium]|nr:hypothetical protein [Chloroflexota bacterium]
MLLKQSRSIAFMMFMGLAAILAAAACGGGEPEALDIPVSIQAGVMSPETIRVKQGDLVTLKIQADEPGEFHLHTYDIESDIPGEELTDFYFVADATGRFRITYHHKQEESGHGSLFESEELAPGDTFSYEIDEHLAGETVAFHSHLHPILTGSLMVSQGSNSAAAVSITYTDTEATPSEVNVGPGTVVTWTNASSTPQTVVSGHHADLEVDEHDDHDEEEEEIDIGFLEVQPR